MLENGDESPPSAAPKQDGGPSCVPKGTVKRHRHDEVYSQLAGLEAVQSIAGTHLRGSPALTCRENCDQVK